MASKELDRGLKGLGSQLFGAVKQAVSVRVRVECKECGGYRRVFDSSPCPHPSAHDGASFDHDVRIRMVDAPKKEPVAREVLSAPIKTVPKELYKSKEERINEVVNEVAPFVPRTDGGYARTAAARAPTQETDPFNTKMERYCASIAYENNNTGQTDDEEEAFEAVPRFFIGRDE